MKNGWNVIKSFTKQATRTQIAIAAVCMIIGFLIVTQLKAHQTSAQVLQKATESDLSQLINSLNAEIITLKAEEANLRLQQFKIQRDSSDSSAVMRESFKNINDLKILAGMTDVSGLGVKVRVQDEQRVLNSTDLVDIITELRVGGAESLSINGVRIIASTGVVQSDHGSVVDGNLVTAPFEVLAIGDPEVLYEALTIAGGVKDKLTSLSGVTIRITKEDTVRIKAVSTPNIVKSSS